MTTVDEPRRENRVLMFAGHYAYLAVLAAVALQLADDGTRQSIGALDDAASTGWGFFLFAFIADMRYHSERLCERCIASTPLDPQAAVSRWRPALYLAHAKWLAAGYGLLLIADITMGLVHHGHRLGWQNAIDIAFLVTVMVFFGVKHIHRKLYPWCPWCHWGGGGHHEASPDVPAPAVSR